jgi:hypothetical protein
MNRNSIITSLFLFFCFFMSAQEEMNLIPRTELFKEKDIVSVQIAKDGKNHISKEN